MENVDVAAVRDKVQRYLLEVLNTVEVVRDGDFTFRQGSARVFISVQSFGGDKVTVKIVAPIVHDTPVSPEVYKYVATEGSYKFGHLSCNEKDGKVSVYFAHTLLGDFLDPEELKMAVFLLAKSADEVDDEIVGKFGGKRFHEG
jgi:hypothetical protein